MFSHFKKSTSILTDQNTQMVGNDQWLATICNADVYLLMILAVDYHQQTDFLLMRYFLSGPWCQTIYPRIKQSWQNFELGLPMENVL